MVDKKLSLKQVIKYNLYIFNSYMILMTTEIIFFFRLNILNY